MNNMSQVTIPKKEYEKLKQHSSAYKKIATKLFSAVVKNSVNEVVDDFKKTGLYTKKFLRDFEVGLKKSSYSK